MAYQITLPPQAVDEVLQRRILRDGLDLVMDLERSHGVWLYDSKHNRELLDFFGCYATIPLGYNHPKMVEDENFQKHLLRAALINPTNADIYTQEYAHFMQTFERVAIPPYLKYAFFIAGGALAVENALKVAMDWKVQKNFAKGYRREVGTKVIHFQQAFHGRSGYTLSLTNTDPVKIQYFAKFSDWPRILNPKLRFPLTPESLAQTIADEELAIRQIKQAFVEHGDDICAIIIEPIQSEGGDNHFRPEFMRALRQLADENDVMLIYDEVQTGVGATGKFWAHEHFGPEALPDIISFGKKMQVCGILVGPKVDEVPTNVFRVPSRINSTWGGNLADMVRADKILEIIEEDRVVEHAARVGDYLKRRIEELAQSFPEFIGGVRGMGLMVAFDLPTKEMRDKLVKDALDKENLLLLKAGERSIRSRSALTITTEEIDEGIERLERLLASYKVGKVVSFS
ncbi:MAG: L-lysine 6-transaminase [Bacteroidia bacterium]|nr:L-lysine 6-transaminase [Bacteroidia bacterium]MCX7763487.1 L-lysine 6-transaminase [Bacteroidia bacterium]MDW8057399.1 L-lysine 6-transaminase [Bacteroidia bacterium]